MALMTCPECGKQASDKAESCPSCGFPIANFLKEQTKKEKKAKRTSDASEKAKLKFSDQELLEAINSKNGEAKKVIEDPEKVERFLERLEKKLKDIPGVGEYISDIVCMISLVRSYIKKEYTDIPIGSIIGIVSALLYIATPFDLIPDGFPVIGYADDMAVIAFALKMMSSDIEEYKIWRKENGKQIIDEN